MKNLENYGVLEMRMHELQHIEGGYILFPWKKAWDVASKIGTALELGAALDEFVSGWNSVDC